MFNSRKLIALFRPSLLTPYERLLRMIEVGRFGEAHALASDLLNESGLEIGRRVALLNKRGIALVHLDRRPDALADFQACLELDPQFAPTLVNVGNLLFEDGQTEDAIAHYEAAIRCDDLYAIGHLNLGVALKALGRHVESVRELRRASRLEGRFFKKPSRLA
ncbi:MAG: tetratricopeptide repeat protein [Candidatus Eremiobacteraeota bacterium]|nr:tetratricopeptide repeat protein [Candidatus Eremiobacteraeota bacterium]